jgi:hypothetical protein
MKRIQSVYAKRGFRITTVLMDGEFEPTRGALADMHINLNVVSRDEHVLEVERHIRILKERIRSVWNTMPFKRISERMVVELVAFNTFWLNSFPPRDGISPTLSPRALVVGTGIDYTKHCKLEYGTYVHAHEEHDNGMGPRTVGAIAMRPTGNAQGGHCFYSLSSVRILNRNRWRVLPMPADVIDRVHVLSRRGRGVPGVEFLDRHGVVVDDEAEDDADDESFVPDGDADDDSDDDDNDAIDDAESVDDGNGGDEAEGPNPGGIDEDNAGVDPFPDDPDVPNADDPPNPLRAVAGVYDAAIIDKNEAEADEEVAELDNETTTKQMKECLQQECLQPMMMKRKTTIWSKSCRTNTGPALVDMNYEPGARATTVTFIRC